MDIIRGGKREGYETLKPLVISAERGELNPVIEGIVAQSNRPVEGLLDGLGIEDRHKVWIREGFDRAAYRVTDTESVATDLDIVLQGELIDQLAELRGVDSVKIHLSIFDVADSVAKRVLLPENVSPQKFTWAYELGRYAGSVLHRSATASISPLSIPPKLGMHTFFKKVADDIYGEDHGITLLPEDQVAASAVEDYRQNGLPERLSSAMGKLFAIYFYDINEDFLVEFDQSLRNKVIHPYSLALDFGTDYRPYISYGELAASHPFNQEEMGKYLEYISEPSDTIYLQDI